MLICGIGDGAGALGGGHAGGPAAGEAHSAGARLWLPARRHRHGGRAVAAGRVSDALVHLRPRPGEPVMCVCLCM